MQKHGLFAVGDRPVELEVLDRDGEDSYDGGIEVEAAMETAADVVVVAAGGAVQAVALPEAVEDRRAVLDDDAADLVVELRRHQS